MKNLARAKPPQKPREAEQEPTYFRQAQDAGGVSAFAGASAWIGMRARSIVTTLCAAAERSGRPQA